MKKIDLTPFREKFVAEAKDRISRMNNLLVHLERNPGHVRVEKDLLREAHTLKGAANMMGLPKISELSHRFEGALSGRNEKEAAIERELSDALFSTLDVLSRLVESVGQEEPESVDIAETLECFKVAAASTKHSPLPARQTGHPPADLRRKEDLPTDSWSDPGRTIRVEAEKLEQMANLLTGIVGRQLREEEIRGKIGALGREYRDLSAEIAMCVENAIARGGVSPEFASEIMPVIEKGKKAFREVEARMSDLRRREEEETTAQAQELEDLRSGLLATHMIPLSPLFEMFHRLVRDLSQQEGKEVDLIVRGGKTEIDRKVAEAITDPMMHLVRNAVDHGIELPEVRKERKKPPRGTIILSATPKKGKVVIEVEDDGQGVDLALIREIAVRKGFVTEKAAYRLDDKELLSFLFRQGFSTAGTMTDVSGRGIGMDIVQATAEKFHGTVDIVSAPGKGTRVILELPFSMALSRVLLFRVGPQQFGIPVMHSEGIIRFTDRDINTVEGKRTLRFDETPVPVVDLSHLLDMGGRPTRRGESLAILVRHSQRKIALLIDGVEGEEDVVVRNLGSYLGKVPMFMGSTVLGSGEVTLLLDVHDLVSVMRLKPEASTPATGGRDRKSREILVVENSLLSREIQQRILASAEHHVETAQDARTALDMLQQRRFDLVVASSRIAESNGGAFLSGIRSSPRLKDLPVILVVSGKEPGVREHALSCGAQECVEDENFCIETLRPILGRLLEGRA